MPSIGAASMRRRPLVGIQYRASRGEGDRSLLHLLDEQAIGAVGSAEDEHFLVVLPRNDERVDLVVPNRLQSVFGLVQAEPQPFDFRGELLAREVRQRMGMRPLCPFLRRVPAELAPNQCPLCVREVADDPTDGVRQFAHKRGMASI